MRPLHAPRKNQLGQRRPDRWLMPIALAVSAAVHALILNLPLSSVGPPPQSTSAPSSPFETLSAIRLLDVPSQPILATNELPEVVVEPRIEPAVTVSRSTRQLADAHGSLDSAIGTPSGRRFGPWGMDPRLSYTLDEVPPDPPERTAPGGDALRGRIEAINDSLALEAAARERAARWSLPVDQGRQWSVGSDGVSIGGIQLPLRYCSAGPCSGSILAVPPGRRAEYSDRLRTYGEIRQQAGRAELESTLSERIDAIRRRERARRNSGGNGGASDHARRE